jgi:hypothetical protein
MMAKPRPSSFRLLSAESENVAVLVVAAKARTGAINKAANAVFIVTEFIVL